MATNTADSSTEHTGNGSTTSFSISFTYLSTAEIDVKVNNVVKSISSDYTISGQTLTFGSAPSNGHVISIKRDTNIGQKKVDFEDGSVLTETDLDNNTNQLLFGIQEIADDYVKRDGSQTITGDIKFEGSVDDANETTLTVTNPTADRTITVPDVTGTIVTTGDTSTVSTGMIANDAITNAKIADDSIDSAQYIDGSIDTQHIANENITTAKLANDAVTSSKLADNAVLTSNITDSNVTTAKIADNNITTAKIVNDAIDATKLADNAVGSVHYQDGSINRVHLEADIIDSTKLEDNAVNSEHYVDGSIQTAHIADSQITTAKIANSNITTSKIADDAVTNAKIADGTLDGRYYTETELDAGQLDSRYFTETELTNGALDGRYFTETEADARYFNISTGDTIKDGDTFPDNDTTIATTAAINDRIIDLVDDVGGFVPIASETNFPTANPDVNNGSGTLVSIKAIGSTRTPSSGTVTISNGAGSNTVTITGCGSTVLTAGFGVIVETTSTLHTYAFHRLVPKATEVTTVAANATNIAAAGANTTNITTVANNNSNINTVAGISSNITTVAGIQANVTTVAGISSDVTAVAADATDIGAVAAKATEIGRLGTADAVADMNTLGTTAIVSDMDTLADISSNITTVAGISSNVTTVAGIQANVTTVAGISSNVTSVANDATDIGTVANSINNVNTVASNISNVNSFAGTYQIASSAPSTDGAGNALAAGDLYFDTSANELRVYNGSTFQGGVTATGNLAGLGANTFTGDQTIQSTLPTLNFTESDGNPDYRLIVSNGEFKVQDTTNSNATRLKVNTDGHIDLKTNVDCEAGLDVTGNITVSGNVDGRDVAADGTKLDGIESGATADQTASEILSLISNQAISTTGTGSTFGRLTISNVNPFITLTDTNNDSDFSIRGSSGNFVIRDDTNAASRLTINSSGTVDVAGNLDVGAGVDVTGNITATGNLDIADFADTTTNSYLKIAIQDTDGVLKSDDSIKINPAQNALDVDGLNLSSQVIRTNNTEELRLTTGAGNGTVDIKVSPTQITLKGNVAVTGTVDGVDIAARNTLFSGLTSSSGVLTNGVTATTQSAGDNSTKVATTAYTDTAISNLIDSSPSALNTLNELAAALGDDANFSTTVTNSIATKMPLAGGTFTGDVVFNGGSGAASIGGNSDIRFYNGSNWTGDVEGKIQHYNNVLYISGGTGGIIFRESGTNRWRIDGDGHFIPNNGDGLLDIGTNSVRVRNGYFDTLYGDGSNLTNLPSQTDQNFTNADHSKLDGIEANATADQTASEILTLIKTVDGAGSGLDADTLDGVSSASFLRSDAADSASGLLTLSGGLSFGADSRCAAALSSLTDQTTITVNFASGIHHTVTLGGNRTFGDPSNTSATIGQSGSIFIVQDGTGSRTASFHSDYKFAGGTAPTLSTAANAVDRLDYVVRAQDNIHCVVTLDVK